MIRLYTDAATKGNFGPGGIGILIIHPNGQQQTHQMLAPMSNHEAEFAAAIAGFEALRAFAPQPLVSFYSDSKLVIDALDKRYAKHYQPAVTTLLARIADWPQVLWQWVPERQNRGAHALAQQGLWSALRQA